MSEKHYGLSKYLANERPSPELRAQISGIINRKNIVRTYNNNDQSQLCEYYGNRLSSQRLSTTTSIVV